LLQQRTLFTVAGCVLLALFTAHAEAWQQMRYGHIVEHFWGVGMQQLIL
jgi:hypothetical protein